MPPSTKFYVKLIIYVFFLEYQRFIDDMINDITCLQKSPKEPKRAQKSPKEPKKVKLRRAQNVHWSMTTKTVQQTFCWYLNHFEISAEKIWIFVLKWGTNITLSNSDNEYKCIQIHTLLPGGKSPWYSEDHAKRKQDTWSIYRGFKELPVHLPPMSVQDSAYPCMRSTIHSCWLHTCYYICIA